MGLAKCTVQKRAMQNAVQEKAVQNTVRILLSKEVLYK